MSTTLTTLIIVHITSIFIFPYLFHVKLNVYAGLLCKNISESKLYVLRTSYWWDIRAIYIQYFKIFDVCSSINISLQYPSLVADMSAMTNRRPIDDQQKNNRRPTEVHQQTISILTIEKTNQRLKEDQPTEDQQRTNRGPIEDQ